MARGEVNRGKIALTMGRHVAQEFSFGASPLGLAGRLLNKLPKKDKP